MKTVAALAALALLAACADKPQTADRSMSALESLDIAAADCSHGTTDDGRSFILCETGDAGASALRAALEEPSDPSLRLDAVAARYAMSPRSLSGIRPATYSALVLKDRVPAPQRTQPRNALVVDGKVFDIYRVSRGGNVGTVFVERLEA